MKINQDSRATWQAYDPESIRNIKNGINHGASAVRNARAIGEDAIHAVLPDRAIHFAVDAAQTDIGLASALLAPIMFVVGAVVDVIEVAAFPLMLLKNLLDMIVHGFGALVNAFQGEAEESDEYKVEVDAFDFADPSSVFVQLGSRHARDDGYAPVVSRKTGERVYSDVDSVKPVANPQLQLAPPKLKE